MRYQLSLLLSSEALSYCICAEERVLVFRRYPIQVSHRNQGQLHRILKNDSFLSERFGQVLLAVHSAKLALLPEALFSEETATDVLSQLLYLEQDDRVQNQRLGDLHLHFVYALPEWLLASLRTHFPEAALVHGSAGHLLACRAQNTGKAIYVYFTGKHLVLTVLEEKKLLLHNYYSYKNEKDCLYYILLAYEQFGLQADKEPLYISGELSEDSAIYRELYKYIFRTEFLKRPSKYSYLEKLQLFGGDSFFSDLFSLYLCE